MPNAKGFEISEEEKIKFSDEEKAFLERYESSSNGVNIDEYKAGGLTVQIGNFDQRIPVQQFGGILYSSHQ